MHDPRIKAAAEAIARVMRGRWGLATSHELATAAIRAADAQEASPRPRTADMDRVVEAIRSGSATTC